MFLRDLDDDGRFEDLGLDQGGVLMPFDNCPLDANPLQDDMDGDGNGDVCDPLEPSRGVGPADACLAEVSIGGPGRGPARSCRDGQAGCDIDDVPGQWTVRINVCLLVPDVRFPACSERRPAIARVVVDAVARELGPRAADDVTAGLVSAALAGLGGGTSEAGVVTFRPGLEPRSTSRCTEVLPVVVPQARAGRPGRRTIHLGVSTVGGRTVRTAVSLRCLPGN